MHFPIHQSLEEAQEQLRKESFELFEYPKPIRFTRAVQETMDDEDRKKRFVMVGRGTLLSANIALGSGTAVELVQAKGNSEIMFVSPTMTL